MHKLTAVGCDDCHGVHGGRTNAQLLKRGDSSAAIRTAEGQGRGYLERHLLVAPETELCLSCHQEVKAKFYLPTRHKVLEGAVKCTDCHTPHGTMQRASLRKWNRFNDAGDACFQCHPEKRGPWVFEHAAGKVEGCMVCHVPHGSANRFLLIRKDVRRVCLECHGARHFNPQSCITCHTQVHGSNFSTLFCQ
jgi:DmsE family decaheme c-type cytochrome